MTVSDTIYVEFSIEISLSFNTSTYIVNEDVGTLSPILTLNKPSPCYITVLAELTDVSATGEYIATVL